MKNIIYILALVIICVAGFFSYKNIQPHQDELDLTAKVAKDNAKIRAEVNNLVKQIIEQKAITDTEQNKKNEFIATIDLKNGNKRNIMKQVRILDGGFDEIKEQNSGMNYSISEIEKLAEDLGVPIDQIPETFEELKAESKKLNEQHVNILTEVERLEEEANSKQEEIATLNAAENARKTNLKANGASSLITAVDRDWGFVIIKPHTDAHIKQDSKLIIVRGSKHVGRLSINSIEEGRVLANIDYGSIVEGLRVQPGDRVILSKSMTR